MVPELRWFVAGYLVLWGGFLVFLYVSWNEFALWQKMLFGLIELLLTPDVSDLKFAVTGKSNIYKTK